MSTRPDKNEKKKRRPGNIKNWKKILLNRWFLIGAGALLIYALLGFFLAPRLVENFVTDFGRQTLKRQTAIGEVRVNPFLFTLEANDFSLAEEDGRPIVSFGRLFIDFELSSLFRWAWTFADIRIENPSLFAEIETDGRLNFAKLQESLPESEGPTPDEKNSQPPRLVIRHAQIIDGSFTFSDRSGATPAKETFAPLNFAFKEISTLPERKGPYTINADLPGGGKVAWEGEVSLQPLFSEGRFSMSGFKLATAWQFARDKLRLEKPEGEIHAETSYRFTYLEHTPLLVLENGNFELQGLKLVKMGRTEPLVALKSIMFSNVGFDLKNKLTTVPEASLKNGRISASVSNAGVIDWQTLVASEKPPKRDTPPPREQTADDEPWRVKAEAVKIENVAVDYKDSSRINPLTLAVGALNLSLDAAAAVGRGEPRATINNLQMALNHVALSSEGEDEPLVKLDSLGLNDGKVDAGSRSIELDRIEVNGGVSYMLRDQEGRIRLAEAFAPADRGMVRRRIAEIDQKSKDQGSPWSFRLNTFAINNFKTLLEDRTFPSPVQYTLQDIRATVDKIANDAKTPMQFDTEIDIEQGGNLKIRGQAGISGDEAEAEIEVSGFGLMPLQPAVSQYSAFVLKSGSVSAKAKIEYQRKDSSPQVRVEGDVSVDDFRLDEASTSERALEWNKLTASGINFGLSPDRLSIKKVRLQEPGAKILISEDRRLNLAEAIKAPAKKDAEKSPSAKPAATGKKQGMFPVEIGAIRLEKGTVDFSDLSLVFPFAARVTDFKGGIADMSSAKDSRSAVKFDGQVGQYGLAIVEGSLIPFFPKDFTDIRVKFQNIEMQTLSPYSATFAGRKIASGDLNLDLEYKIQDSQLLGENKVVLERFTLGERVESPDAVSLPLDLAVALLTDSNGVIDLAVPVRGDLDDPEFSYGQVIWKAFVNLITKVATSPFRALDSLFGGGEEQIGSIGFNPGSSRILPPEREKLKKLVQALEKRPQLRLVVLGRFDPESDGLALRTERVKRSLATEMNEDIPPEEEPGPVAFDKAKTQRTLEKLLERRSGDKAIENFMADYEEKTGKEAKRVNPALGIFGVGSPDTEFYKALFEKLVKLEPLEESSLQELARKRAEAVAEELESTFGLDEKRVAIGDTAAVEKPSKETIAIPFQLDVLPGASN